MAVWVGAAWQALLQPPPWCLLPRPKSQERPHLWTVHQLHLLMRTSKVETSVEQGLTHQKVEPPTGSPGQVLPWLVLFSLEEIL